VLHAYVGWSVCVCVRIFFGRKQKTMECVGRREFLKKEQKNLNRRFYILVCWRHTERRVPALYNDRPQKRGSCCYRREIAGCQNPKKKFFQEIKE
jgi:hypothetical protein